MNYVGILWIKFVSGTLGSGYTNTDYRDTVLS